MGEPSPVELFDIANPEVQTSRQIVHGLDIYQTAMAIETKLSLGDGGDEDACRLRIADSPDVVGLGLFIGGPTDWAPLLRDV